MKHGFLLWRVAHDRLLTNKARMERQLSQDAHCSACHYPVEEGAHALRDCPMAEFLWKQVIAHGQVQEFFAKPLKEWILWNLLKGGIEEIPPGLSLFTTMLWEIWNWRNKRIFEENLMEPLDPIRCVFSKASDIWLKVKRSREEILVSWKFPPSHWVKL